MKISSNKFIQTGILIFFQNLFSKFKTVHKICLHEKLDFNIELPNSSGMYIPVKTSQAYQVPQTLA